ncbi:hypothetical protein [Neglectibacter caecimuris]|uniref:hypothetical protein n=1 Tax=Neglectibacter caecimuris TaxID=3093658 RepID=UPI002AC99566|nr:hypothetical protein [Neglectibacter sp. M00184]
MGLEQSVFQGLMKNNGFSMENALARPSAQQAYHILKTEGFSPETSWYLLESNGYSLKGISEKTGYTPELDSGPNGNLLENGWEETFQLPDLLDDGEEDLLQRDQGLSGEMLELPGVGEGALSNGKRIENFDISEYNEIVEKYADIDTKVVWQTAKNGGKHKGIYNDAMKHKEGPLKKSIISHTMQVEEHARKVADPVSYDSGWAQKDQRAKEGLLNKWRKDLQRNAEQASIEMEVWKERFGNEY